MTDDEIKNLTVTDDNIKTSRIQLPPSPNWIIHIDDNTYITVVGAPNAFNRWMQRICFGLRWERIPK